MKNPFDKPPSILSGDRKPHSSTKPHAAMALSSMSKSGFEVIGHNPVLGDSMSSTSAVHGSPVAGKEAAAMPEEKMTSDNYTRVYLQREAAAKAIEEQKIRDRAGPVDQKRKEQQQLEETARANSHRLRARDLQGQIAGLQQQLGQGPDADNRTEASIQTLRNELGGIPSIYWD